MKRILKFEVGIVGPCVIAMPRGAKILTVQWQHDRVQCWALCDESEPIAMRRLYIAATGEEMAGGLLLGTYVETFQTHGGAGVWHAFDQGEM